MGYKSRENMTGLSLEGRIRRSELARKAEEEQERRLRAKEAALLLEALAAAKKRRDDMQDAERWKNVP